MSAHATTEPNMARDERILAALRASAADQGLPAVERSEFAAKADQIEARVRSVRASTDDADLTADHRIDEAVRAFKAEQAASASEATTRTYQTTHGPAPEMNTGSEPPVTPLREVHEPYQPAQSAPDSHAAQGATGKPWNWRWAAAVWVPYFGLMAIALVMRAFGLIDN